MRCITLFNAAPGLLFLRKTCNLQQVVTIISSFTCLLFRDRDNIAGVTCLFIYHSSRGTPNFVVI